MRSATCSTQQRLRLLRGDVGVHELEVAHVAGALGRMDTHAVLADDDAIAGMYAVHRHRAHRRVADDDGAVHLGVLDRVPAAVDAHVGREVGRRVEAGGQHAVASSQATSDVVSLAGSVRAVHLQLLEQRLERRVVVHRDLR